MFLYLSTSSRGGWGVIQALLVDLLTCSYPNAALSLAILLAEQCTTLALAVA